MSSKPRGESKPERKVRETVGVARPGTAGTTTAPSMPPAIYSAEPAPKKPAPEPDDYDDDFEAYDDEEFEADEDEPPVKPAPAAQSKPVAKAVPAAKPGGSRVETAPSKGASGPRGSDMDELRLSMQTENLAAMEAAKYASKSESPDHPRGISASYMRQPKAASPEPMAGSPDARPDVASKSRRTKKFASMDIADEGFTFGPKEARLRRLRNSNVLEMRVDSFSAFNLAPTTKFDTYQRQRRGDFYNL